MPRSRDFLTASPQATHHLRAKRLLSALRSWRIRTTARFIISGKRRGVNKNSKGVSLLYVCDYVDMLLCKLEFNQLSIL